MKKLISKIVTVVLVVGFCMSMAISTFAVIGYPEWYYKEFGVYPDGTVNDWKYDPVYHQYLSETGQQQPETTKRRQEYDERYYPRIDDTYWSGKTAKWDVNGYASKYQVKLYRDGSLVTTKTTTSRSQSFASYMTRGDNDYFFQVRAYNKDTNWWSDWEESDTKYISGSSSSDDDRKGPGIVVPSVGPGQVTPVAPSSSQGTWIQQGGVWYYRLSNGAFAKNTWLNVNGKWYYFDVNGKMVTGWLNDGGKLYYLNPDGSMLTGTVVFDGITHFFDSNGAMVY